MQAENSLNFAHLIIGSDVPEILIFAKKKLEKRKFANKLRMQKLKKHNFENQQKLIVIIELVPTVRPINFFINVLASF